MHQFSRALAEYLASDPKLTQYGFSDEAGIHRSKVCRLLQARITCDRDDLDKILSVVPDVEARRKLVTAYISDYCSPGALLHLKGDHGQWEFDMRPLSPKGQAAFKQLLGSKNVKAFERVLIDLAVALV
jgi:hypothetical protein